jgi:EAL domain-containing protein (putative c-di-GMP-specific phosphodiesterase class I)
MGCSCLQGYLLGRPMPADEFEKAVAWKEAGDRAMKLLA